MHPTYGQRTLARNHVRVVEGVHHGQALLPRQPLGLLRRLVVVAPVQLDGDGGAPEGAHGVDLDLRRGQRHDDDRLDVVLGGGEGHALRVVPRGAGHDAALQVRGRGGHDFVVGPPQLEGEDGLQVLALCVWRGGVCGLVCVGLAHCVKIQSCGGERRHHTHLEQHGVLDGPRHVRRGLQGRLYCHLVHTRIQDARQIVVLR